MVDWLIINHARFYSSQKISPFLSKSSISKLFGESETILDQQTNKQQILLMQDFPKILSRPSFSTSLGSLEKFQKSFLFSKFLSRESSAIIFSKLNCPFSDNFAFFKKIFILVKTSQQEKILGSKNVEKN